MSDQKRPGEANHKISYDPVTGKITIETGKEIAGAKGKIYYAYEDGTHKVGEAGSVKAGTYSAEAKHENSFTPATGKTEDQSSIEMN